MALDPKVHRHIERRLIEYGSLPVSDKVFQGTLVMAHPA
jgi:hypothetical protein